MDTKIRAPLPTNAKFSQKNIPKVVSLKQTIKNRLTTCKINKTSNMAKTERNKQLYIKKLRVS
jgi:hypothetical protein